MENRPLYGKRIFIAFIIATILFAAGFLIGYAVSYSKYQSISNSQENIRYNLLSLDLEKELLSSSCTLFDPFSFAEELDNNGRLLDILEQRFGKFDSRVLDQKKDYSMLGIQHLLLVNQYNKQCKGNITTLLFFYSNDKDYASEAERIGTVLSTIKQQDNNIMVYSFDFSLDSQLLRMFKARYNVTKPNIIIVNENKTIENLNGITELENALKR